MDTIITYLKANPAKVLGMVSAIFLVLTAFGLKIADDQQMAILAFLSSIITLVGGQVVQNVEDQKSVDNLYTEVPTDALDVWSDDEPTSGE